MTNPSVDPMVGRTVAQYEIVARRGGGGMGVVYEARDSKLGRTVALKFLPQQWSHDDSAKQRFVREAQAASATHHPNICTIHDIETADDGQLFIVMAYYEGATLKQRLESDGPLPVQEALDIATQVAEGLAKAHAQGIVHRDIKPGNLILTEDGVRIVDFGLATFADALQLTMPGSTLGTAAYMSPEQARGEEADARSDVWAVGVILYEMLLGHVPFRGAYAEAIAYAIRNDTPPPLGDERPEIPEEVEQLVFRALHKDPVVRYQNGRELARGLRQARGQTVPLDLRTQAVDVSAPGVVGPRRPRRSAKRLLTTVAAAVLLPIVLGAWWLFRPVTRIPIVVAPVANETGFAELDEYRLALTYVLIAQLVESEYVRVTPYSRVLRTVQRFDGAGADIASRDAIDALSAGSHAHFVIVPSLRYENRAFHASVAFRRPDTATGTEYDTMAVASTLRKETAYTLVTSLAETIHDRFATKRGRVAAALGDAFGRRSGTLTPPVGTIDAAQALSEGLAAFDASEYDDARRAFETALQQDRGSATAAAWLTRTTMLMRQDEAASDAADTATVNLGQDASTVARLFTEAVAAEAKNDFAIADARYRELAGRDRDDATWVLERAAYHDRRSQTSDAIEGYHRALELDDQLVRPHLELCRLYNRSNEAAKAREHGERALDGFRRMADPVGEAHALLCRTDTLRVGGDSELHAAEQHAKSALGAFDAAGARYNRARAYHYVALIAKARGQLGDASTSWEASLEGARATHNSGLEAGVLTNLGVTHEAIGDRERALDYFRQSYTLNERLGNEQGAAYSRANAGALLIEYGDDPQEGLRDVENALEVFRRIKDRNFEAFCLQLIGVYHRYAGSKAEAERALNQALTIAKEVGNADDVALITIDLGRVRFDAGEYVSARQLFAEAAEGGTGLNAVQARIRLGQVQARLGDFAAAGAAFDAAASGLASSGERLLQTLLETARGELAYELGHAANALAHFRLAAAGWTEALPDPATLEARAYLGLLEGVQNDTPAGRSNVETCLADARRTGRLMLEHRCGTYLGRILLRHGQAADAVRVLTDLLNRDPAVLSPEIRAQEYYWRARALRAQGDVEGASVAERHARRLLDDVLASLDEEDRGRFAHRVDIRVVLG